MVARYIPIDHFRGVEASFAAVRDRDIAVARRFGLARFVRRALPGEWPKAWLSTRSAKVIEGIKNDFVVVDVGPGVYRKFVSEEVDPVGKLGLSVMPRRRRRATGRGVRDG